MDGINQVQQHLKNVDWTTKLSGESRVCEAYTSSVRAEPEAAQTRNAAPHELGSGNALPGSPGSDSPAGAPNSTEQEKQQLRVLLVDDHLDTLSILTRLLRSRGHHVDSAATGKEALNLLESNEYDVLVSDIGLPDVNGLELMRTARAHGSDLKGIALSGFGMDADISASMDAGYFAHLVKPVDWPKLDDAISRCM